MPLVLNAQNNGQYGGNLVNQKYAPLLGIQLAQVDNAYYRALFTNRQQVFTGINAYPPNVLEFYGTLPAVAAHPPMVIASSGRAAWMRGILDDAAQYADFNNGYLDQNTFLAAGIVPWYAPERSGNRRVYVVVHWSEYDYYEAQIGNGRYPDVFVAAYRFTATRPALDLVGFGASRYAALQLMIHRGYARAWAVDDNVINVNGFPATPAPVEALMTNVPPVWGIGFNGATSNCTAQDVNADTTFAAGAIALNAAGLLQQVVLWNLDLLRPAHVNYSPLFVASNEDVGFSNYLIASARPTSVITACTVVKIEPAADGADNLGFTRDLPKRRNRVLQILNGIEYDIAINPGAGQVTLGTFITATVLPGAQQPQSAAMVSQARAIEQVMAAAVRRNWIPAANPFDPYNGAANVQLLAPAALPTPAALARPAIHEAPLSAFS
jgi:hypothetical protein